MPRYYKKKIGGKFKNYEPQKIKKALEDQKENPLEVPQDTTEYPNLPSLTNSRDKKLSEHEEKTFAEEIAQFAEWRFPMTFWGT